ncbi:hypothetical protein DV711_12380 [Motiliproteus coralliicola]|uniref:Uncharacterized protein n=1 Tax=Motiliproteus coralliicola TaxID=2283196 RepID=A0A369WEF4_9GAMM|nr:hypothetical protein [Motiliproteus coralliicola]RDE19673.1 hypothetical protein DV711_12380 [Motiliproteus coralliicola]
MTQLQRSSSKARNKALLFGVPTALIFALFIYGKAAWVGWSFFAVLGVGVALFFKLKTDISDIYEAENEKFIEVTNDFIKMVEPSQNYEGFIRFKDVASAEISTLHGTPQKIRFFMQNSQKIDISGYEGLTAAAQAVKDYPGLAVTEI